MYKGCDKNPFCENKISLLKDIALTSNDIIAGNGRVFKAFMFMLLLVLPFIVDVMFGPAPFFFSHSLDAMLWLYDYLSINLMDGNDHFNDIIAGYGRM